MNSDRGTSSIKRLQRPHLLNRGIMVEPATGAKKRILMNDGV